MAPKTKANTAKCNPKFLGVRTEQFYNVSKADDSSWRVIAQAHVDELLTMIWDGDFGSTTVQRASLLGDSQGQILESSFDGKPRLRDGKHIIVALEQTVLWIAKDIPSRFADEISELVLNALKDAQDDMSKFQQVAQLLKLKDEEDGQWVITYGWLVEPLREVLTT